MTNNSLTWTNLKQMEGSFNNIFTPLADGVFGIRTEMKFGIGQEAYLVASDGGYVLWDCLGFIDTMTISALKKIGKLNAIAVSHPHFLGSVIEWSERFGNIPVYIHADNMPWVPRKSPTVQFWTGNQMDLGSSLKIIRTGGHFPGSCVLHRLDGKGDLFTSDSILPVEDRRWVSFMYSYPNLIPLGKKSVETIEAAVGNLQFDTIYGGPMYRGVATRPIITSDAKGIVMRSIKRYLDHLSSS